MAIRTSMSHSPMSDLNVSDKLRSRSTAASRPAGREAHPLLPLRRADTSTGSTRPTGEAIRMPGRRPASYWFKTQRVGDASSLALLRRGGARGPAPGQRPARRTSSAGASPATRARRRSPRSCCATGGAPTGRGGSSSASWRPPRRSSSSTKSGWPADSRASRPSSPTSTWTGCRTCPPTRPARR